MPGFLSGEIPLEREPIQIVMNHPQEILDPASRVHYAKTYTVEHNVKVQKIGRIGKHSVRAFSGSLLSVQAEGRTFPTDN